MSSTRQTATKQTFPLTKYSRVIPQRSSGQQGPSNELEWEHHTEKNMRLILEYKHLPSGAFGSLRIRVVVEKDSLSSFQTSASNPVDDVVYEDIDLIALRSHRYSFQMNGSPVKTVYRDNSMGFRYLPISARSASASEYSRFQVAFLMSRSVSEIISTIQDVCPCKENQAPSGSSSNSHQVHRAPTIFGQQPSSGAFNYDEPQFSQTTSRTPLRSRYLTAATMSTPYVRRTDFPAGTDNGSFSARVSRQPTKQMPNFQQQLSTAAPDFHFDSSQRPGSAYMHQGFNYDSSSSSPVPHRASQQLVSVPQQPTPLSVPLSRYQLAPTINQIPQPTPPPSSQGVAYSSSHSNPHSQGQMHVSQANSTQHLLEPELQHNTPAPAKVTRSVEIQTEPLPEDNTSDPIITSLLEDPKLANLPLADLENLIGHVIREEGFLQFVEKVDRLWQFKGLV